MGDRGRWWVARGVALVALAVVVTVVPAGRLTDPEEAARTPPGEPCATTPCASGGGAPAPPGTAPSLHRRLLGLVGRMSLEEKVGQLFMTYAYGRTVDDRDPEMVAANRRAWGVDNAAELVGRYHLGGVALFGIRGNVHDAGQVAELTRGLQRVAAGQRLGVPLLIGIDQENGLITRLGPPVTQLPGNMALGATRRAADARAAGRITGQELRALGINLDFAPVADVNVNPANPVIGMRSFGADPALVSELTAAAVRGLQEGGVAATAKHFPGHGDTSVDSHTGLPVIDHSRAELERVDLPPFRAAVDAGVEVVMSAHIVVPALDDSGRPATLSRPILTGLLRERLGFDGVVVTDALSMAGVRQMFGDDRVPVEALKAGADLLLMPPEGALDAQYRAVLAAVRSGGLDAGRIDRSVYRVLRLKARLGLFEQPSPAPEALAEVVGSTGHRREAAAIADRGVTLLRNRDGVLPLPRRGQRVLVAGWGKRTTATLGERLRDRGLRATVRATGKDPDAAEVAAAVREAGHHDLVVVATMRAGRAPGQQRLVRELLDGPAPVVVVAVREPYDLTAFPEAPTYVATYGAGTVSLGALARVLFGEVEPVGRLPVAIPAPEPGGESLQRFGSGIGYSR